MDLIVLQSEAYKQLQHDMFTYVKKSMNEERKKPAIEWLDSTQAADLLMISKRTLQSWRDDGLIGFSQVVGKIYYNREEIDRMLLKHHHNAFRAAA